MPGFSHVMDFELPPLCHWYPFFSTPRSFLLIESWSISEAGRSQQTISMLPSTENPCFFCASNAGNNSPEVTGTSKGIGKHQPTTWCWSVTSFYTHIPPLSFCWVGHGFLERPQANPKQGRIAPFFHSSESQCWLIKGSKAVEYLMFGSQTQAWR